MFKKFSLLCRLILGLFAVKASMSGVKLFVVKIFYRLSFLTALRLDDAIKEHEFIKRNSQLCNTKLFHTTACLLRSR
jgi:hypothetical protein